MATDGAESDVTVEPGDGGAREAGADEFVGEGEPGDAGEAVAEGDAGEADVGSDDAAEVDAGVASLSMPTGDPGDETVDRFVDLAREALSDVAPAGDVGEFVGFADEGNGVFSARFTTASTAYPGWFWTVSMTQLEDDVPNVLETELMPGDDARLAPPWVPWAQRLALYREEHADGPSDAEQSGPRAIALERRERRRVRTRVNGDETRVETTADGASGAAAPGGDGAAADARSGDAAPPASGAPAATEPREDAEASASASRSAGGRTRRTIASRRRRVTVSGRQERSAGRTRAGSDDLVVAADVREFADEMDDVLDGVDFESEVQEFEAQEPEASEPETPEPDDS